MADASVSRIVFLREDDQLDQVDLLMATLGTQDQPVQMLAALGPGEASVWAWTHVRIVDRRDGRPQAAARCACDHVLQAASQVVDAYAQDIRTLLDGHGRKLSADCSMSMHADRFGDAFLLLCFERPAVSGALPGTVLPVLLHLPPGMLPSAACGGCATCLALAGATAVPTEPAPADHGYAAVATVQEPAGGSPSPADPSHPPTADAPTCGPAGGADGQEG